jgi:phosphoribosylanthranilate isomerase
VTGSDAALASPLGDRVKVKVCGLRSAADAVACAAAGADWIGLNFHPPSPRYIDHGVAAEIIAALPAGVGAVGVFVDRPAAEVADVAARLGLSIVQLHGQEPPHDLVALNHLCLVRAFRLGDIASTARMAVYLDKCRALGRVPDAVLVDSYVPGPLGGTGARISDDVLRVLPYLHLPRLILAGGLTPENVVARVARVHPWMVDVASGVESAPGRKDPARVAAFVRAVQPGAQ